MLPWKKETFWTPLAIEEVRGRVQDVFPTSRLFEDDTFWVTVRMKNRNSWRPWIEGELVEANGGTLIHARFPVSVGVLLFTFLHGIPFLGLSWLVGIAAYLWGVGQVRPPFEEQLDVTLTGDEARRHAAAQRVADPRSDGAAGAAPLVFRARAGVDGATFRLSSGVLEVRGGGLRYDGRDLGWDVIERVQAESGEVMVIGEDGVVTVLPCAGMEPEEVEWLATYLETRNARWSTPEEQREAEARARAKLQQMVR